MRRISGFTEAASSSVYLVLLVLGIVAAAVMGCSDPVVSVESRAPQSALDIADPILLTPTRGSSNPEPQWLISEFEAEARRIYESVYELSWDQLIQMDLNDLPDPV